MPLEACIELGTHNWQTLGNACVTLGYESWPNCDKATGCNGYEDSDYIVGCTNGTTVSLPLPLDKVVEYCEKQKSFIIQLD